MKASKTSYLVAVAAIAAAGFARWLFDPFLGDHLPFVTFFVAVAVAAWFGGLRPALLATLLGFLVSAYFFVPPRYSLFGISGPHLFGLAMYFMVCLVFSAFGETMRRAVSQAEWGRERLRTTLASIGDAVITTDTEGHITHLNAVAESLTGWRNDEATAQALETVFHIVDEQTRKPVENPVTRALRDGVIAGLANHTVLIAKDGTERPVADSAAPIRDGHGNVVGCVLIFRDVTKQREAERAVRESEARKAAMLQTALDCIISIDHEGKIIEFNPAAEQLFGYRCEDVLGREMAELIIPPALRERHRRGMAHYLATGEGPVLGKRIEITAMRSDGTEFPIELSITPIVTAGAPLFTGYLRDISERVRLENELRERAEELDAANQGKTDFIAVLSHELRSPLNAISGWAEIMKLPTLSDDDRRKGLEIIIRNSHMQAQLISDLLDVNRIATGKLSLELRTVDLRDEIETAIDTALPAAKEKQIRVESEGNPGPAFIRGDATRLQQVLGNLLSNAIKFTPEGGEVRVALRQEDARVEVSVSDSGQGISADALPRIFEPFRQSESLSSRAKGGLGLGLAVSKQLVELHGGTVSARSPGKGEGATFTVSLPLVSESRPALAAKGGPETSSVSLGGCMVLVVDDEPGAREPVRRVLEEHGAEVVTVRSAAEALVAIRQQRPDVLVSDIGMPGRDGYDLIRAIRALPPEHGGRIPAIALTAFGTIEDRERALRAGYMTHVAKPVEPTELLAALAALISRASSEQT